MKQFNWKHLICILFMFVISVPLFLGCLYLFSGIRLDATLVNDNSAYISKPSFSVPNFMDGSFQTQFEKYFNAKFPSRNSMIKTYNQANFLLFGETKNLVINNGYIYEKSYLEDYAGRTYNPKNPKIKQALDSYMDALEQISQKLEKQGKKLIVYSAPNKCDYTESHIPWKYQKAKEENQYSVTALDYFNQHISSRDVTYIHFGPLLEQAEYPVFYKNGIHWSRPAEQTVSQKVVEAISDFYGNVKPILFTGIRQSTTPFSREEDIVSTANLWTQAKETYYEYSTQKLPDDAYEKPVIFIQGDSFSEGLFSDIQSNGITDTCYLTLRDNLVRSINNEVIVDTRKYKHIGLTVWTSPELPPLIEESDIICIEFCSSIMNLQNSGFIEYLNEMLGE